MRNGFFGGCGCTFKLAAGAEAIAEHVRQQTHALVGPCAAIYRNRLGGRIISLAYTPWAFAQSVAKHRQWRQVEVAWQGRDFRLMWDGKEAAAVKLPMDMALPKSASSLEIGKLAVTASVDYQLGKITFGPVKGAVMDDLVMRGK